MNTFVVVVQWVELIIVMMSRNLKRPESANSEEHDVRFMLEAWKMANKSEDKQTKVSKRL